MRSLSNWFNRIRLSSRPSFVDRFSPSRCEGRKVYRYSEFQVAKKKKKKKKKSAGILGSYAPRAKPLLRFSSNASALTAQSSKLKNIYEDRF